MIVQVAMGIIIAVLALLLIDLLVKLIDYFDARKKVEINEAELLATQVDNMKNPECDYAIRVEYNDKLLTLISTLVDIEVGSKLKTLILLGVDYKITDIDSDIKEVSDIVFNAIKPEIMNDKFNMMTSDYIMAYITKATSMNILMHYKEIHDNFKPSNE